MGVEPRSPRVGQPERRWVGSETGSAAPLIGREADLHRLRDLLAAHALVTVTGPGGVGKTSLALAAAHTAPAGAESTGVVLCELAEIDSPEAVRHAVAARLGVVLRAEAQDGPALPIVEEGSELLVVLDNCEHVLDAAAETADRLLAAGPRIRVLATSREPLRLPREHVMVLDPLAVPASADDSDAATASSVVLFAQRAREAAPFELDERTLPDVVRICRGLDGIPLALEVAAARTRVLAVSDIADRLSRRFTLLRSDTRRTPARHRSLRAVVDWSYDLLEPPERGLLGSLAVYPAGCDLQAAAAEGEALGIDADDLVDVLDGLVAKSLMTVSTSPHGTRYGMLETLREYGLERLDRAGGLALARDRHADYYASLARRLRETLVRTWGREALSLFAEFDNIRSALTWALDQDTSPDRCFDLLSPLWYAALQRSAEETSALADLALERWPDPTHPRWSEVAGTAAAARATLEDYDGARLLGRAAAGASSSSQIGVAFGHCALADVALHAEDDPAGALDHLARADEAAAAAGFEPLRCDLTGRRAVALAQSGHREEALATAEKALAMARAQGNAYELAWSQHLVGLLLLSTRPAGAREWLYRALTESQVLLYPYGTGSSLRGLGAAAAAQGDLGEAAGYFSDALDAFLRAGNLGERWDTLAALLPLLVAAGRRESAATLLAGLEASGAVATRIHAPSLDDARDALAEELGTARVIARGRAMSPAQLVALARSELRRLRGAGDPRASVPSAEPVDGRADVGGAVLSSVGDLWRATFAGTTVYLPGLRGIRDLAVLLAQPGREVPALDLATPPPLSDGSGRDRNARVKSDDLGAPGDLGERIDAKARADYAARIRQLQAELDDADTSGDPEGGARAQQELDFLTHELTAAYGLRGPRRAGDPAEKARSAVTARIRAAIAKIREVHPELGRHLETSIRTGRFCSYQPDPATTWAITW